MSTLVLMRHGKSSYPADISDHERPLAPRGRREAALAGDWIRTHVGGVDAVRCSTSTRTRETLAATGVKAPVEFDRGIYGAGHEQLLEVLRTVPEAAQVVLLVGHAPGTPELALALDLDSEFRDQVSDHFPTSAIAVLDIDGPWSSLAEDRARLTHVHVAR